MERLLTSEQVQDALETLYAKVLSNMPKDGRVAIIGIRTRGETIAGRMVERLREQAPDVEINYGVLDVTFYRDDLSRRRNAPLVRATEIDFDVDETWMLLVDDVVQTGRSIRAALDAIHDFGRPKIIRLGVLIDRGGRELPIAADYVGETLDAPDTSRVQVRMKENDGEEGVFLIRQP
ncbi:MAG: bifunctional pyr operon transcriptional regulator/uracil phosphoribosyltransferase PyrR [Phycisphaerae bacterium]